MPHRWIKPWACWGGTRLGPRGDHVGQASFDHRPPRKGQSMTEPIPLNPQHLDDEKVVLLQTRKRDGSWVDTPVNIAVRGDRAYFRTPGKASKNKRLRNFPEVPDPALHMVGQTNRRPSHDGARPAAVRRGVRGGRAADRPEVPGATTPAGAPGAKIMRTPTLHYELTP